MPNFLSTLSNLKRQSAVFIVLIATLMAGYNLSIKPIKQQLAKLKKSNLALTQNIHTLRNQLPQKTALQTALKNLALPSQYHAQCNLAMLLADFTHSATMVKINTNTLLQNQNTVTISVNGTYPQLVQFTQLLTQIPCPLEFSAFSLTPSTTPSRLVLHANYTIYPAASATVAPYHPIFRSPKNPDLRDPFSINNNLPLTVWSSNALHFIGIIKQNEKIWAIVTDPNGATHHATLGTPIGLDQSPITKITAEEITAKNPNDNLYRHVE